MTFDLASLTAFVPMLILVGVGCVVLLGETFITAERRSGLAWISLAGCVAAMAALVAQWGEAAALEVPASYFSGMLVVDRMALFLDGVFIVTAAITILLAEPYVREHGFELGEIYALVLFGAAGMMVVVHAQNLVALLIGIETMSLAVYVLTGSWRRSLRSSEAALKYFLMGAFATGFMVYGIALVYGMTGGELGYPQIAGKATEAASSPIFLMGVYLLIVALGFKVAAVPFHMWAPDAYEGAPTPVTGFMAAGVKAAAFGAVVRLLGEAFSSPALVLDSTGWVYVLSSLAFLTMTLGNLAALRQENVKRLLAYSSIGHAGYLLLGTVAMGLGAEGARPSVLFYLLAYSLTTLGSFGIVAWIGNRSDERLFIDDWAGLGARRPAAALAMTVFLLSLGGVPPTAGFFAKFYLFRSAMEKPQLYVLVVVAVLNSVISIYYYLRVVVAMYFREPLRPFAPTGSASNRIALMLTAAAVVLLGLLPGTVLEWVNPVVKAVAETAGR